MRYLVIFFMFLSYSNIAISQNADFPISWQGEWKGDLKIYSTNQTDTVPVTVIPMSLTIYPLEKNRWDWTISYEVSGQYPREYELIKDSLNNWYIDEKNGIVLNQKFIGSRMVSSFSVMENLLICYYWMEEEVLHMEIHMTSSDVMQTTGLNTEETPVVGIHRFGAYQIAKLNKFN